MTKPYLKFPNLRLSFLPKIESRRFKFDGKDDFIHAAYRADMSAEEKADRADLLESVKTILKDGLATRATKEEIATAVKDATKGFDDVPLDALRTLADDKTGVLVKLGEMGIEVQKMKTQLNDNTKPDLSMRGQIESWMKSVTKKGGTETVADVIKEIRSGTERNLPPLELNIRAAASPMTTATVNSGASPMIGRFEVEPGVNDFVRTKPNFWNFLVKGRTNALTYWWVNKHNAQGAADFIAPGVLKPGVSFELVTENSVAKKVADSLKCTTELLEDIDGMMSFINDELAYQVFIKVNSVLMSSAGSSTVPTGIQNLSVAFTNATIKTTNATYVDAIRAVIGQLRSGLLTGDITVFINPADAATMDMSKAVDSGVYLLPPFASPNGMIIAGVPVIEDYNIPVGYIQAGFMRFYRILIYKDFTVSWGWENDDFTKNLVTAVGEMRLHQFFNDIYTGAFVYDTFANVIAAINTVAP